MIAASSPLFADLLAGFAIIGLLAAVLMAALRLRAAGQREAEQEREREALSAAYSELAAAKGAAEQRASQLAATLEGMSDGVLMTDADFRLLQWNERWVELVGLPPDLLKVGISLEDMIRAQAEAGEFGNIDVEVEVARRMRRIRTMGSDEDIERTRPDGRVIRIRRRVLPDQSMVSVVTDITDERRIQPRAPASAEPAAPRRLRRCFILLVEDILVNQIVTATALRREGHRVDIASSGVEALALLGTNPYDVVLMDLMMPGMSGIEATVAIRAMPGHAARTPILALTAAVRSQDRAECLRVGMQGMLSKPVRPEELSESVAAVLAPGAPRPMARPAPAAVATSAPPAPPADALLDLPRLTDLREGLPPGLFQQLAQQCIVDMRERMMDLADSIETGDIGRTAEAAHALAGMAGSYGMAAVERRMRGIMAAAGAGNIKLCRVASDGMDDELLRTETGLTALIGAAA